MTAPTAIVFGYADVGARCLEVLLSAGVDVRAVVTHFDDPAETRWYADVAAIAADYGLTCLRPERADDPRVAGLVASEPVDFIFSFYYRQLLPPGLLARARRGALNLHGSLLPKYRGRAPINWAPRRRSRLRPRAQWAQ